MLKKLLTAAVIGAAAKLVLDKLKDNNAEADLWAEATDSVRANR